MDYSKIYNSLMERSFTRVIDGYSAEPVYVVPKELESFMKSVSYDDSQDGFFRCIQTNPKILFQLDLDTLLGLLKIPTRK